MTLWEWRQTVESAVPMWAVWVLLAVCAAATLALYLIDRRSRR